MEKAVADYRAEKLRNPATPEEIWTLLWNNSRQIEETDRQMKETDRQMKETARQMKESDLKWEKTAAKIDRLSENVGGLKRSVGELIEILIAARLWEKFPEYDMQRAYRRLPIYDEHNQTKTDIDILLVNSEWAMVVEVKSDVDNKDIDRHLERMKRVLRYPPALLPPGVKVLGAMAGGVVPPEAADYAHECGFFVLELAGESVVRLPAPPEFKPKEFTGS